MTYQRRGRPDREPQVPLFDPVWHRSREDRVRWEEKFRLRKVALGRSVHLPDTTRFRLEERFAAVGWAPILTYDLPCWPDLVRHFYCNMRVVDDDQQFTITSWVRGVEIVLTTESLSEMLGVEHTEEMTYFPPKTYPIHICFPSDYRKVLTTLCTGRVGTRVKEVSLRPPCRLISRVIQLNILPRSGHRDAVTSFQAFLTYCVYVSYPVNLPYIIMKTMSFAIHSRTAGRLPYGLLLSRIFAHCGVDVSDQAEVTSPRLDYGTLVKMHIHTYAGSDDEMEQVASPARRYGDSPSPVRVREEVGGPSAADFAGPSSTGMESLLQQLQLMQQTTQSGLEALGRRIDMTADRLEQQIRDSAGRIDMVSQRLDTTAGNLGNQIYSVSQYLGGRIDTMAHDLGHLRQRFDEVHPSWAGSMDVGAYPPPSGDRVDGAPASGDPPLQ